jgi:hypothetical protein
MCVPKGDYQLTKGKHSEKSIPTGKIQGFRKFDKVLYKGKEYFVKGRMSTDYLILMDVHGKTVKLDHTIKCSEVKRISARRSILYSITEGGVACIPEASFRGFYATHKI